MPEKGGAGRSIMAKRMLSTHRAKKTGELAENMAVLVAPFFLKRTHSLTTKERRRINNDRCTSDDARKKLQGFVQHECRVLQSADKG